MYSAKIMQLLKNKSIRVGDEISVSVKGKEYCGLLMPRPFGNEEILILKLKNGYNICVSASGATIKLLKKAAGSPNTTANNKAQDKTCPGGISILGCGGTIASKIEYKTGAVYPAISSSELRMAFPTIDRIVKISSRQLFTLFSDDMNATHWRILAEEIFKEIKSGADGIVVMHGTDTMSYTAAALSFMLRNLPVPVIFVGSQRSSDRPSSENEMNMLNAVFSAQQDIGEVGVCMHANTNDEYCYLHHGARVRKMHTSRRDAFHSINSKPLAAVDYRSRRFDILSACKKRSREPLIKESRMCDNVALIYVHPNIKPSFIASLSEYDGVVLIGTGLGHVPTNVFNDKTVTAIYPQIKALVDSGIPVVMSPQTICGRLNMKVYTNGRFLLDAGVVGHNMDWTPESAYVKLCWVLGQTRNMKKIAELMTTNLVGEISSRTLPDLEVPL